MNNSIKLSYVFASRIKLWEIFVPHANHEDGVPFPFSVHEEWDNKVIEIAGGLTLGGTLSGKYQSINKELMITVRIACTRNDLQKIIEFTKQHYKQEKVFAWKVSDEVVIQ